MLTSTIKTSAHKITKGKLAGYFGSRITVYENNRRLWSETINCAVLNKKDALDLAKQHAEFYKETSSGITVAII
jgi:hypothetical protein